GETRRRGDKETGRRGDGETSFGHGLRTVPCSGRPAVGPGGVVGRPRPNQFCLLVSSSPCLLVSSSPCLLFSFSPCLSVSSKEPLVMSSAVLSLLAHPDDAEFFCAGVLIRLQREHGWQVHIASMTAGDCGSTQLDAEAISEVRRVEGARAAALIGATYHCLE